MGRSCRLHLVRSGSRWNSGTIRPVLPSMPGPSGTGRNVAHDSTDSACPDGFSVGFSLRTLPLPPFAQVISIRAWEAPALVHGSATSVSPSRTLPPRAGRQRRTTPSAYGACFRRRRPSPCSATPKRFALPGRRRHIVPGLWYLGPYRATCSLMPLMPMAIEHLDLSGYDLVVSTSSSFAGACWRRRAVHVCYLHADPLPVAAAPLRGRLRVPAPTKALCPTPASAPLMGPPRRRASPTYC